MNKTLAHSQRKLIIERLESGGTIERAEAFGLGIANLTARIAEIRQEGRNVMDKWVEVINQYGQKTRYKVYFMA